MIETITLEYVVVGFTSVIVVLISFSFMKNNKLEKKMDKLEEKIDKFINCFDEKTNQLNKDLQQRCTELTNEFNEKLKLFETSLMNRLEKDKEEQIAKMKSFEDTMKLRFKSIEDQIKSLDDRIRDLNDLVQTEQENTKKKESKSDNSLFGTLRKTLKKDRINVSSDSDENKTNNHPLLSSTNRHSEPQIIKATA